MEQLLLRGLSENLKHQLRILHNSAPWGKELLAELINQKQVIAIMICTYLRAHDICGGGGGIYWRNQFKGQVEVWRLPRV